MNFGVAATLAKEEGIEVESVRVWDDVASAPPQKFRDRGGLAVDFFVIKPTPHFQRSNAWRRKREITQELPRSPSAPQFFPAVVNRLSQSVTTRCSSESAHTERKEFERQRFFPQTRRR